MAYRRRRYGARRRYRRRFGSKRRVRNKVAPAGQTMGQLSRVPRLRRFNAPIHRFKLVRMELELELRVPQLMPWSSSSVAVTPGNVAMWHLQPFSLDISRSYVGYNTLDIPMSTTNHLVSPSVYGAFGAQSFKYKWLNEVKTQWNEYQPLAYKYDITLCPEHDRPNRECSTRVGVFLSYRDHDNNAIIPVPQTTGTDHDQLNAFCAFPDVKWARVPRNHDQKWPRFTGFVRARDYAGTGSADSFHSSTLNSNWWAIDDIWGPTQQERLPNLCIFAGNYLNTLESDEGSLRLKFTLYARVRQLIDRDPHTNTVA